MISPDAEPIAHHPPRPRIETNTVWPANPTVAETVGELAERIQRDIEAKRIWKLIEQAAQE